jgi:hypothetical protein
VKLRQDLEAAVEDQLRFGKAGANRAHRLDQAFDLARAFFIGLSDQVKRIEGIEEETAVALLPQRGDDSIDEETRPLGLRLIDD